MTSVADAEKFISGELRKKLTKDFDGQPFRIFREHDLHACCYYHLRKFFSSDHRWTILNEPNLRNLKGRGINARPDIVLLFAKKKGDELEPTILFELKFRRRHGGSGKKDTKVLRRATRPGKHYKRWAKKAYYVETVIDLQKTNQLSRRKYRNKVITIPMQKHRDSFTKIFESMRNPRRPPRPTGTRKD